MTGINRIKPWVTVFILLLGVSVYADEDTTKQSTTTAPAGKVLLSVGDVYSERNTKKVALKRRSKIYENDVINVGDKAKAQIRMIDSAVISLQENSVFKIKSYRYHKDNQNDEGNSAFIELLSGGLRTISGQIGKSNKKAYQLVTPLATIGIRGTDYQIKLVDNDLYIGVWEGAINVSSRLKADSDIQLGDSSPYSFLVMKKNGKTQKLKSAPAAFSADKTTPANNVNNIPDSELPDPVLNATNTVRKALLVNQTKAGKVTSATPTMVDGTPIQFDTTTSQITPNAGSTHAAQAIGGYDVSWGSWASTTTNPVGNTNSQDAMLWTSYKPSSTENVSSKTGTVQYNHVVDSLTSSSSGNVSNLDVDMNVNFDSGTVSNGVISANTNTDTWVGLFEGQVQNGDLELQMNDASVISTNPSSIGPIRDASGSINGDFVGNQAEGVVGAFEMSEDNTSNHIQGVFVVEPGTP